MRANTKQIFLFILSFFLINNLTAHTINYKNNNNQPNFTEEEIKYLQSNPKINIAMMSNFKPFSFIEDQKHQGFTVDILHSISDISGLNFHIQTGLWRDNLQNFKDGKYDIISGISYTKKREDFTLFSDAYYEIPTYIFGLKNNNDYKTIDDLKNKKVGISHSMYYKDDLVRHGIEIIEVKNSKEKAKALILGEIDYFLASYTSGKKAIISQSLTSIKPIDEFKGVKKEDLRFGINKNNPLLHSIINKSLKFISKKEFTQLINKWILELKEVDNHTVSLTKLEQEYLFQKESLNLCIDPNWMPFEKIDKYGNHIGLSSEYFSIFKEKLHIPINLIKTNSWSESLEYIKDKKCDILSLVMETQEREKYMNFSKSYLKTPLVLATKFNIPFIDDLKQLRNTKIGIVKDYAFEAVLKRKYPNLNLVSVKNIDEGLEKTLDGEIFGIIDSLPTIVHKLQFEDYLGELKIGAKFDEKWFLNIGIRKDSIILQNIFNKLIDSITENQKQEILNKHISIKYENSFDYSLIWKVSIFILIIFLFLIYRQYIQNKNNEQLKESFNKIQTILDTTMEAIIISKDGRIIDVNEEFLKLFKYKNKDEILGKRVADLVEKNSRETLLKNLKLEFTAPYELQFSKSTKELFFGLIRGKNIKTKNANFRVSTLLDLTEIKEKEALLIQQSKIATAGEMLENISHQWRQPLSQISTISTGIKIQKEFGILKEDELINNMNSINNSAQYLSQTIEDFKGFLKPNTEKISSFNVKDTIKKLKQLTKDAYEYHNIEIITDIKDCSITQNENLLIQALLNITNNAKDAIIEKHTNDEDKAFIFISLESDEDKVTIKIKDNGGGIDTNIINKVFEPYFTTKHESVGTGIGLYMTYQIIKNQMKGTINVKNTSFEYNKQKQIGAEFSIVLPH